MSFSSSCFRNALKPNIEHEMNVVGLEPDINDPVIAEKGVTLIHNMIEMNAKPLSKER